MADFKIAKAKTLKWEGGYCNVEGDKGGETIFGIARNMHPDLKLWNIVDDYKKTVAPFDKSKYAELEKLCLGNVQFVEQMENFYKKEFWDKIKGDEIQSQDSANAIFDFAVNSGVTRATKYAQSTLSVYSDGVFGAQTLEKLNSVGVAFCNHYCDNRASFFKEIAQKGENAKFLKGWLRRVNDFYVK
ncbi:hypothetical protein CQA37_09365 [Helicobacter sp. MIT 99-10781]|uniref:glycoside hydrolase family 108 protein n=1 Tax=unclassified Helicobacter TaxID=2593540 RepID=UPI000E37A458|nr:MULTISPECIES: glycosyl hydrolase 108 family protein [unclassified Helicobacter]RDU51775.1 hypothetical protein CQA37_09365 [Helicobacter sp. MIT 99-10781]